MELPSSTIKAAPFYKAHSIDPAWAMVAAAVVIVVTYAGVVATTALGLLPLWLGALAAFGTIYIGLSVAHECTHQTLSGRDRSRVWINETAGYLTSAMLLYDFPTFRLLHLEHHRFTNNPQRDPDFWMQQVPPLQCFLRSLFVPLHYLRFYVNLYRKGLVPASDFRLSMLRIAAIVGVMGVLLVLFPVHTFLLWIMPASITSATGSLAHRLMHTEVVSDNLQKTSRIILGVNVMDWPVRLFFWLHNNHYVHHVFPRLTALTHDDLYAGMRDDLREEGMTEIRIGETRRHG
jgi:beta-carotene hydroxylase